MISHGDHEGTKLSICFGEKYLIIRNLGGESWEGEQKKKKKGAVDSPV